MFGGPQKSSEANQWAAALLLRNSGLKHKRKAYFKLKVMR